jgi:hypothetical protein
MGRGPSFAGTGLAGSRGGTIGLLLSEERFYRVR